MFFSDYVHAHGFFLLSTLMSLVHDEAEHFV